MYLLSKLFTRNMKENPSANMQGGRKFFFPRIMKAPVVKYSPVGADLDTCAAYTHHADVTTFASHAILKNKRNINGCLYKFHDDCKNTNLYDTAIWPASLSVFGGTGNPVGFMMMMLEAPGMSAWTYMSVDRI